MRTTDFKFNLFEFGKLKIIYFFVSQNFSF